MKVWITKYALTQGIIETEAEEVSDNMIRVPGRFAAYFHGEGKDWHKTLESAKDRAEITRYKKIQTLFLQCEKLRKLKF